MYYYHKGEGAGWYFSNVYLGGQDDWVAYSQTAPMGRLHVPWWARDSLEGAQLMGYAEYAEMQITQLQQELEAKLAEGTC